MGLNRILKSYSKQEKILSSVLLCVLVMSIFSAAKIAYFSQKPQSNGAVYTEGIVGELTSTNPLYRDYSQVNRDLSYLVFRGLTKYNPEKNSFDPDLADFTINSNSTIFTFHLRENLKWQDGTDLTIEDILYTYKSVIQNEKFQNSILKGNFNGVQIEITAENEITFTLSSPNSFFISNTDIPIIPRHIYNTTPVETIGETNFEDKIIGSGPYEVNSIIRKSPSQVEISLSRSKSFTGKIPKVKNIKLSIFKTNEELILNQDSLDTLPHLPYSLEKQINKENFELADYILPQYSAIFINTDKDVLDKKIIRKALNSASNKELLVEELESKQQIDGPFFQLAGEEDSTPNPSVEEVKSELEFAGWSLNDENIYIKDDKKLEFELTIQNLPNNKIKDNENQKVAQHFIEAYSKVGIKIIPRYLDQEVYNNVLQRKNFQLILAGHYLGNNFDTYSFWHSSQGGINGSNLSNYQNPSTDQLLQDLREDNDSQSKRKILEALNQKIEQDIPAIFLYTEKQLFAFDNKIKKRKILKSYAFPSDRFYQIEDWIIR